MKKNIHKQVMILELLADDKPRSALEIGRHLYVWLFARVYSDLQALEHYGFIESYWEEGPRPRRRLYRLYRRAR